MSAAPPQVTTDKRTPGEPRLEQDRPDLRLVAPAGAAWIVAWQVRGLPVSPVLVAAALLLGAGLVVVRHPHVLGNRRVHAALVVATLLCASAAAVATAGRAGARTTGPLPALAAAEAVVQLEVVVTDDPRPSASSRPGRAPLLVIRARAVLLDAEGVQTRLRTPVLLLSDDPGWLELLPSQRVRTVAKLVPAERGDDVAVVASARGGPTVLSPPSRVQRVAGHLRAGLREAVAPLPEAEAGLLPGLVVGDTTRLTPETREDFRTVGLTHLTAVSGSNVVIVLAAVLLLSRWLGLGLKAGPVLGGLGLLAFVVLARPSPSVLRAGAMGAVGLLALATGGTRRAVPALAGAVLVLVLFSPELAASPGFAMSVLATGGLLVLAPPWRERLAGRVPGWLADAIAVPAAAQLAVGPVIVAISGQLGLLSVPANLLAVPSVAPATVLGVAVALVAPVSMTAAQGLAWLAYLPTAWLVLISKVGATLPGAALPWPEGGRGALLLGAVSVGALIAGGRPRLRRVLLTLGTAVAVTLLGVREVAPGWPPRDWALVMCDVGQGDALVVRTGPRAAIVVDAGPDPDLMDSCLSDLAVRQVPLVILTHPHADHIDGLSGVLDGRAVGAVEVSPVAEPAAQVDRVSALAAAAGVPVLVAAPGERRSAGGLSWEVLGPRRAYRGSGSEAANASIVLRLRIGGPEGFSALLTGDVEPEAQSDLVASGTDLRSTVLKVPHHGSRNQLPEFLTAVQARVSLTGVGAGNTYGHPSADTLGLLTATGARSYRTDQDGAIALVLRDGGLTVIARSGTGSTG